MMFILITVRSGSNSSFSYENTGAGPKSDNGLDIFLNVIIKHGYYSSKFKECFLRNDKISLLLQSLFNNGNYIL